MVGRRRKSTRKLAAGPQRSWLWGRHAVVEALTAGRWLPLEVRTAAPLGFDTGEQVRRLCNQHTIALTEHPSEQLTRWCGTGEHQGLLALMPPYPYVELDQALANSQSPALVVILDRIQDPHNFGAILRSSEVFGVDAVIVGEASQCEVTPHVARSSAGAVNYLPIVRVPDLAECPATLWAHSGILTYAATGYADVAAQECNLREPCAIIIGNEGAGVARPLLDAANARIRIPQSGRVESLNAAVAAGVLLYEVQRQRSE